MDIDIQLTPLTRLPYPDSDICNASWTLSVYRLGLRVNPV